MTDAILPRSPPWATQKTALIILAFSSLPPLLAVGQTIFFFSPQSSPLSIMRRAHPIYGPLVSKKLFFHHSSFLLN